MTGRMIVANEYDELDPEDDAELGEFIRQECLARTGIDLHFPGPRKEDRAPQGQPSPSA